ncbi:MAG TPA: FAD-dependent oxidoreductase, partial [Phenylobacterium sp.]|nr:FAD-dependent oxidoreductase [Phenylobacterium sp.]
ADLAMLPVENSTYGRVADIHRLLPDSGLHIVDEAFVRVRIALMSLPGTRLDQVHHVRAHLGEEMDKKGIKVLLGCQHDQVTKGPDGLTSHLSSGHEVTSDLVLFATGREPYVEGLGLEAAGVETRDGAIVVDAFSRTSVDGVWAVGDVTNRIILTPVAIREGAAFAQTEFYDNPTSFDHEMVASAVFSQPAIGSVGLTEAEARRQHRQA